MPDETRHEIETALADWRDLVAMAEERMDALTAAMEQARWAMTRLSSMATSMSEVRWEQTESAAAVAEPVTVEQPAAPIVAPAPPPYFAEPAPWPTARRDVSAAQESVELEPEPELESEPELKSEFESAPELDSEPASEIPVEESAALDSETLREEVRQAVAAARAELEEGANYRDEQQPMTADWGPLSGDWGPAVPPGEPGEADDEREKVRRAVEEARAEMMVAGAADELVEAPINESQEGGETASVGDPEDEREKVRRAVEAARAELMGLSERRGIPAEPHFDEDEAGGEDGTPRQPKPKWQPASRDDSAFNAPVVVIEDGEGHVELARVYEILSRLELASQATLQNYTTHSVSIGINTKEGMPEAGKLGEVVKAVFGRPCQVVTEGSRLSVQLGHANGRVA